jgi:anti-sigma factor RsiW
MNELEFNQLLEADRQRRLTVAEEAQVRSYLAAHPEAQAVWDDELGLNRLLSQLPDAALASNFTAQILERVARESRRDQRTPLWVRWWTGVRALNPVQKGATAASFLCLILLSYYGYQVHARETLAKSVAEVSNVAALANVETLKDFEAIRRLPPSVDFELLEYLQTE